MRGTPEGRDFMHFLRPRNGVALCVATLLIAAASPAANAATLLFPGFNDIAVATVPGVESSASGLRLAPNGDILVASGGSRSLYRVNPATGAATIIATAPESSAGLVDVTVLGNELIVTAQNAPHVLQGNLDQTGGALTPFLTLEGTRNPARERPRARLAE